MDSTFHWEDSRWNVSPQKVFVIWRQHHPSCSKGNFFFLLLFCLWHTKWDWKLCRFSARDQRETLNIFGEFIQTTISVQIAWLTFGFPSTSWFLRSSFGWQSTELDSPFFCLLLQILVYWFECWKALVGSICWKRRSKDSNFSSSHSKSSTIPTGTICYSMYSFSHGSFL
jgi:hypothetical protein